MKRRFLTASITVLLTALPAVAASAPLSDVAPGGILAGCAPKADVEKVGQLIDALKDELDALSVRVANIEETLGVRRAQQERGRALTARVAEGSEAERPSKQDLEKAQRRIDVLRDKLDLLSVRVTNLEAARGASGAKPQVMLRIRPSAPQLHSAGDDSPKQWLRLGASVRDALAGVTFPIFAVQGDGIAVAFEAPPQVSATLRAGSADSGGSIGSAVFGIAPVLAAYAPSGAPSVWSGDLALRMLDANVRGFPTALLAPPLRANWLPAGASFTLPASDTALHPGVLRLAGPATPSLEGAAAIGMSPPALLPAVADSELGFSVSPIPHLEPYATDLSSFAPYGHAWRMNESVPLRLGSVRLQATFGLARLQGITSGAHDVLQDCGGLGALCASALSGGSFEDQLSAGTAFDLRALGRRISLNLGASYGLLHRPDLTAFPYESYDPATEDQPPIAAGAIAPLTFNPNYVDVSRRALGAGAAVPLTRDLTLNVQYNTQFYTGSHETFGQSIDAHNNSYLGNLTYTIPRTSSSIVFSAKQYRYRDALLPTYNVTQNRADLNFTIKF